MRIFGYRYFAIEPYAATLEQFCNGQYTGPMPSDAQVLSQIAKGINFLHTKGFAHGNLNPQTVLIGQSQPVRMKVAEFGLRKSIVEFGNSPDNENSANNLSQRDLNKEAFSDKQGISKLNFIYWFIFNLLTFDI